MARKASLKLERNPKVGFGICNEAMQTTTSRCANVLKPQPACIILHKECPGN